MTTPAIWQSLSLCVSVVWAGYQHTCFLTTPGPGVISINWVACSPSSISSSCIYHLHTIQNPFTPETLPWHAQPVLLTPHPILVVTFSVSFYYLFIIKICLKATLLSGIKSCSSVILSFLFWLLSWVVTVCVCVSLCVRVYVCVCGGGVCYCFFLIAQVSQSCAFLCSFVEFHCSALHTLREVWLIHCSTAFAHVSPGIGHLSALRSGCLFDSSHIRGSLLTNVFCKTSFAIFCLLLVTLRDPTCQGIYIV